MATRGLGLGQDAHMILNAAQDGIVIFVDVENTHGAQLVLRAVISSTPAT
jgi:hypothetical protein